MSTNTIFLCLLLGELHVEYIMAWVHGKLKHYLEKSLKKSPIISKDIMIQMIRQSNGGTLERGRSPRMAGQYNTPQAMYSEVRLSEKCGISRNVKL